MRMRVRIFISRFFNGFAFTTPHSLRACRFLYGVLLLILLLLSLFDTRIRAPHRFWFIFHIIIQ